MANPTRKTLGSIQDIKKKHDAAEAARVAGKGNVSDLSKKGSPLIKDETVAYFRDVYDRVFEAMDLIENTRDMVSSLIDIYLSSMSNKTNEVMKVLTVVATIFIPLTFIVGLYGMNFKYMPELDSPWGYPAILDRHAGRRHRHAGLFPDEKVDLDGRQAPISTDGFTLLNPSEREGTSPV